MFVFFIIRWNNKLLFDWALYVLNNFVFFLLNLFFFFVGRLLGNLGFCHLAKHGFDIARRNCFLSRIRFLSLTLNFFLLDWTSCLFRLKLIFVICCGCFLFPWSFRLFWCFWSTIDDWTRIAALFYLSLNDRFWSILDIDRQVHTFREGNTLLFCCHTI